MAIINILYTQRRVFGLLESYHESKNASFYF